MPASRVDVVVVLQAADESSIPLEVASHVEAEDVSQTVCAFERPVGPTFGVAVESLDGSHRLDPGAYRKLYGHLRAADVVHVHPNAVGAVTKLLATVAGTAIVKSEHNTHAAWSVPKNLVNGTTNLLADVVAPVSESVAGSFRAWEDRLLDLADVRKTVVHNGVDVDAVRENAARDPPVDLPEGFLVGGGGRMVPQKNLETLLEAMAEVRQRRSGVHLVLTGDGPLRGRLERRADDLGIAESVHFTGFLPERGDVHAVLGSVDVFAFPSLYEGWPIGPAEAMAAGTPVVASDVPSLRAVAGSTGTYADPNDPGDVADRIASLHDDPDRRRDLGEAARRRIEDRFRIERTAEEYVALYRSVAGTGSGEP